MSTPNAPSIFDPSKYSNLREYVEAVQGAPLDYSRANQQDIVNAAVNAMYGNKDTSALQSLFQSQPTATTTPTSQQTSAPVGALTQAATTTPSPADPIENLYRQYAGRSADPSGLEYWRNQFGSEVDPNETAIFQSAIAEARSKGTEPIPTAPTSLYASLTAQSTPQQIADAYKQYVGASGGDTPEARQAASSYLTNLGISAPMIRSAYEQYVMPSRAPSQTATDQTSIGQIEDLYKRYAGRSADPVGLSYWSNQFGSEVDPSEAAIFQRAVAEGAAKGLESPNLATLASYNPYFAENEDVARSYLQNTYGMTPDQFAAEHYISFGKNEGRKPPPDALLLSTLDQRIEKAKDAGDYSSLSSIIGGMSDSQIASATGKSQDEITRLRQMASSKPFSADEFRSSWAQGEDTGDFTAVKSMAAGVSDEGLKRLLGISDDEVKNIRRVSDEAQKNENINTVTQQILSQGTTKNWSGQGFGSPEENSRAIANYFQNAGVSDVKQIGMRPELQQAYLLGYQTKNGDTVYKQNDGKMFYYEADFNGDLSPKLLTPDEEKNVKPVYGRVSEGFLNITNPLDQDKLIEKDGEKYYKTGKLELYNKDTGQAINTDIRYPGGWVHNVLDESPDVFDKVEPGKSYIFGRTFAGDGSTNFNVVFDEKGNPYFYTTYGGSTSTTFSDVAPFLAVAALPFVLPAMGFGAAAGAGAAGAGAGAMTAAELGASFAADMAAAGYAGTAAAGAGAAAAAEVAAGAAGAGAGTAAAATGTAAATGAASTSIATKIGMSLGLEGMSATMAGNALINGTISELTGGDFVKGAVSGALLSPGVTASVGALATQGLSKIGVDWYLSSAAQKALGTALVSATLSGGDLNKAAKAALTSYVGDAIVNSPKFDQYLKDAGIKGIANEAVRSAIGGATISAIRGDNPLTGALTSGAATAIGSLTKGYLEDSKLSKQTANALSKATATFVANKLAGANDQQAFVAAAMAGGSAGIARTAVRDINKIPVETLGPSSSIRSETNPDDLASVYAEQTGKTQYGPAGLTLASSSGELPFRAEGSGYAITAESPEQDKARISVPPGYRLMSENDYIVSQYGDNRAKYIRPAGSYYDALQNAWMTPTGEFDLGGIQDFSGLFGPESQSAGVSPITDSALKAYADAIKSGASEEDALAAANAVSRGDGKGSGTSQVDINSPEMVITAPREPSSPEIVITAPREPKTPEMVITAPREPVEPVTPVEPVVPEVPATPTTPTTPKPPTTPTTPMVPVTPTVPTVPTTPSGGGGSFGGAGSGSSTGQEKTLALAATSLISKIINDKTIDPLEKVKLIQQEMEKEQMMQNLDPRLAAILSEQFGVQPAQQEQQAAPYYAYGQEQSIDDILGNSTPQYASGGYVAPLMAQGGMALPLLAKSGGALDQYAGRENFKDGKHVAGEGDGQSDDIPAWLADGEFVFPADVVSALGNGSTKAGTDKLYEMMHSIRERARSKDPEDLPPPALKSPLDYLKSHKRSK